MLLKNILPHRSPPHPIHTPHRLLPDSPTRRLRRSLSPALPLQYRSGSGNDDMLSVSYCPAAPVITGMLGGSIERVATYSLASNIAVALLAPPVFTLIGAEGLLTLWPPPSP